MSALSAWLSRGDRGYWVVLAAFLLLAAFGWVGFIASDDMTYAKGAYGWIEHFPYVGGHGTIRYTLTVPMALCFLLLGENELAMEVPCLLYAAGFLWLVWRAARDVAGPLIALGGLAAIITLPLLAIQVTIADVDVIEMFFLTGSVLLFWRCLDQGASAARLIGAGAMAGAAFLTRETAVFIIPFYALLFLAGHRLPRVQYLWIPLGFLAVWGLEVAYLTAMTGDPLYRINIALHHDPSIDRGVDLAGNVIVNPLVDPLLVLLLNQEFMLLFYLAVPLALWLAFSSGIEPRLRHFARIIGLFALVWFGCAGAVQHLLPLNPRYFMITAAMASLLAGVALARLAMAGRRGAWGAGLGFAALIGANLAGIYVENKVPAFGEHELARIAAAHPGALIHTDPMTRYRADYLLRWAKVRDRVVPTPPVPGSLYFHDPVHADAPNFKLSAADLPRYQPQPGWTVVETAAPRETMLAWLLERTGIAPHLPGGVWRKLRYHHPSVTLYRVYSR